MQLLTGNPVQWHTGGPKGAWVPERQQVSIRHGMTDAQTRSALAHEAAHAERGDPPCGPGSLKESLADRRAASILIRAPAYAEAERLYGPHPALIAAELGVNREVVETFQRVHPIQNERHPVT